MTPIRLGSTFLAALALAGGATAGERALPHRVLRTLPIEAAREPSGVCLHAQRNTLFVADDRGAVCEFKLDGTLVQRRTFSTDDFEGITSDPATGRLYVAVEGAETLIELDPATLAVLRTFTLPRTFDGVAVLKQGGSGIEAVTFVPNVSHPHGGTFLVANQCDDPTATEDYSALIEVELPLRDTTNRLVRLLRCVRAPRTDIAALHWNEQTRLLYAVSDAEDHLMILSQDLTLLREWRLPGKKQEGLTVLPDGTLCIAQDNGGLLLIAIDPAHVKPIE